jgi:hypothetical protein
MRPSRTSDGGISKYDWLIKLFWMEDSEVKMICGSDATLYLIYLKYCAILCGISKNNPFYKLNSFDILKHNLTTHFLLCRLKRVLSQFSAPKTDFDQCIWQILPSLDSILLYYYLLDAWSHASLLLRGETKGPLD